MITIDDAMLAAHGINISEDDKSAFLEQLQDKIEEQVGLAIVASLKDDDAKRLLEYTSTASDQDVTTWLQTNVPNYEQIVQKEVETVLSDVAASQTK